MAFLKIAAAGDPPRYCCASAPLNDPGKLSAASALYISKRCERTKDSSAQDGRARESPRAALRGCVVVCFFNLRWDRNDPKSELARAVKFARTLATFANFLNNISAKSWRVRSRLYRSRFLELHIEYLCCSIFRRPEYLRTSAALQSRNT